MTEITIESFLLSIINGHERGLSINTRHYNEAQHLLKRLSCTGCDIGEPLEGNEHKGADGVSREAQVAAKDEALRLAVAEGRGQEFVRQRALFENALEEAGLGLGMRQKVMLHVVAPMTVPRAVLEINDLVALPQRAPEKP